MSKEAESALVDAAGGHQGAKVTTDDDTGLELYAKGIVGESGGLTRRGTIVRERLLARRLDEAFG